MYLNIYMTCLRPEGEGRRIRAVADNVGVALDPLAKDVAAPRQHVEHHAPHLSYCVYIHTHTHTHMYAHIICSRPPRYLGVLPQAL